MQWYKRTAAAFCLSAPPFNVPLLTRDAKQNYETDDVILECLSPSRKFI